MTPDEPTLESLAAEPAASVVRTYLERWRDHDVEGMMALLGDGIVIYYWEDGWRASRAILPVSTAWTMAAGFEIPGYELEVEDEDTVHVTLEQRMELYDLLDYSLPTREITFRVTDGIIERIQHHDPPREEVRADIAAYREALAPVVAWARQHRPWEARGLFTRSGVFDASGKSIRGLRRRARRQRLLVEDYRNATELAGLTRDELHSVKWRRESDGGGAAIVNASRRDPETGELVHDNRRIGWRSSAELPTVLAAIIREDGAEKGVWRGTLTS